jgi:hypothetical protein
MNSSTKKPGGSQVYLLLISACLAALVVSTVGSWFFYSRWDELSDQYSAIVSQNNATSIQLDQIETEFQRIYPDLLVLRDPDYRSITMDPVDNSRRDHCRIFWNSYTRKVFFDPLSLSSPDSGKEYRIWCKVDKNFQLVAVLPDSMNDDKLLALGNVASSQQWLISEEQRGDTAATAPGKVIFTGH